MKVLDFGLAKPVDSEAELTKSGAVVGTPAYMSPEQARGLKVDHRTDLFSLGAILYRLCTGKNPFAGPTVLAVLMALGGDEPTPVRELNPVVPEPLARFIHQLLSKKPEDRPQTATEVAKRLRTILDQLLTPGVSSASPVPVPEAPVPLASAAELSVSQPVVINPVPVQPPVVEPLQITATPASAFENLDQKGDAGEPTHIEPTFESEREPQVSRTKARGKTGLLIGAVIGAVLLVGIVVAVVVSQMGKKDDPVVEKNAPTPAVPPDDKGKGDKDKDKGGKSVTPPAPRKEGELPLLPKFEYTPIAAGASPFDKLDPNEIPKEERFDWQPKELVAVVGQHARRHWSGPAIEISPDGKWGLAWVSTNADIGRQPVFEIYDLTTLKAVSAHRLPKSFVVRSARFAPDSRSLLVGGQDGMLIGTFLDGKWEFKPLEGSKNYLFPQLSRSGKVLLLYADRNVQVWDADGDKYTLRKTFPDGSAGHHLGFSADETSVYWATQKENGKPWQIESASLVKGDDTRKVILELPAEFGTILVSPDGKTLAACVGDGQDCRLYDLTVTPPKETARFKWDGAAAGYLQFSPDSKTLCRRLTSIHRMDISTRPPRRLELVPEVYPGSFDITPDGKTLMASDGGVYGGATIRFFDVSGDKPKELHRPQTPIAQSSNLGDSPLLAPGKGLLAVTVDQNGVNDGARGQFWDLTGPAPKLWPNEKQSVVGVSGVSGQSSLQGLSPDGMHAVLFVDLYQQRQAKWTPNGYAIAAEPLPFLVHRMSSSSNGFTLSTKSPAKLWNLADPPEKARSIPDLAEQPEAFAIRPDGGLMVVSYGRGNGETQFWNLTGEKARKVHTLPQTAFQVNVSPDGRWLTVATNQSRLEVYDLSGPQPKLALQFAEDIGSIYATFSPDAKIVYVSDKTGGIRGYLLATGEKLWEAQLPGAAAWIQMAPDGRHLFTHNANGTVYVLRIPDPIAAVAADRAAAEWALSVGGGVGVDVNGATKPIGAAAELPKGAFRLTTVDLRSNQKVTDAGLAVFKDCVNLTTLELAGCTKVTDAGVVHFKNCTGLEHLDLQGVNQVTDAGLSALRGCTRLVGINLTDTRITDATLAIIKDCPKLTHLGLQRTAITDAGIAHLRGHKNLAALSIWNAKVTDAGLEHLKDCPNLNSLGLRGTAVTDAGLAVFKGRTNFTDLDLTNTKVTDAGLANFKESKGLRRLQLEVTQVTDTSLVHVKECKKLEYLDLNHTAVTDAGLERLVGLVGLGQLHLNGTKVTAAGVEKLKKALPKCQIGWAPPK